MKYLNSKVILKDSKIKGPTVAIFAGVHGDEISGVRALDYLIPKIEIKAGKVYFVYANLKAIKQDKRFIEYNLNRCFLDKQKKEMKNTLEGKTAKQLMLVLKKCDYVLDLHSSPNQDDPFVLCEKHCLDFVSCFPVPRVVMGTIVTHPGASDGYLVNNGKIGFCLESGPLKSKKSVDLAKKSVINFLRKLKVIDGVEEVFKKKKFYFAKPFYTVKNGSIKLVKKFKDFQKLKKKTLIGYDGETPVYLEKNDIVLFPGTTIVKCKEIKI
ncbi:MAG: succinylglutamate desuccinylase/aspartoacylase family protein [Candidatus ainarchaeum sp.]|nr:succinylglutamate desuccinylase/aspartoacylase family protein [Candidatus ainarchaeum sp.]